MKPFTKAATAPLRGLKGALQTAESAAKSLYFGEILEDNLFPYPVMPSAEQDNLRAILDAIDDFLRDKSEDFKRWDESGEQPAEFIQSLRDMGLFGLIIPEQYGGLGLSNAAYARVLAQTSRYDSSVSLTIGAHSSIGMKGLLLFGSDAQKQRYLPRLASGELIAAFCLTESGSGSDAASIRTKAVRQDDGSWRLSGEKIWITNGGIAGFYTVFAKTDTAEGKMTAFIVQADWNGVSHGPHEDKMGIRSSNTCTVAFNEVLIPPENVLGEVGKGFKVAMAILNNGRTGLGGGAVGGMRRLIELAIAQSTERKQFGRAIAEFGMVRKKLALMQMDCFAAESAVWMVAHYIDSGCEDYSTEAAISKVFASEAIQRCCYESLQIAAGNGFMKEYAYEKITRDSRILSIFEGTNEILRLYIALSGLKDVGESLKEIRTAVGEIFGNPIKGFGVLTGYAGRRLTEATGIGQDRITSTLSDALRKSAAVYERYTNELAAAADACLRKHGKAIAEQQYALERLGNITIDLFVGLCVLARADMLEKTGHAQAQAAVDIAQLFTKHAKRRISANLRQLASNEDTSIESLCVHSLQTKGYSFDILR
jgi:acyl-CoA dehydrogenase family member 9